MKIALAGVKGKTKLARQIAKEEGCNVIDNIPQRFVKQTSVLVGPHASPQVNTVLAGLRFVEEYKNRDKNFVSTTTVLDSIVYSAYGFIISNEYKRLDTSEYEFTVTYLAGWLLEHWNFDKVIFLPYRGRDKDGRELSDLYERSLETANLAFERVDK